jgi:integrase
VPLTNTAIRNAKPRSKRYRLFDSQGLYVEVAPNGGKWWRLKYRIQKKEKRLSLGVYPEVSLKEARVKRDQARLLISTGTDPIEVRKTQPVFNSVSFEAVAREWFSAFAPSWATSHANRIIRRLENDVFPWLGLCPIDQIEPPALLEVARRIENRGALETAHRAMRNCGQVFRYAVATGRAGRDPTADLKGALSPVRAKHHPSITDPRAIGELLRSIEGYEGSLVARCALQFAPLVFVRPGELRHAAWSEINLAESEWRIPAKKMKNRQPHIVPLARQSIAILSELHAFSGSFEHVFPSVRTVKRPMSENTINAALRRLGYPKDQMTGHGFRSIASTLLNEQGWNRDAIERQLAHTERNTVRAAYNYADYLEDRKRMMQWWADYLDQLKASAVNSSTHHMTN